ncbi:MAG: LytR family transcriptional regulator, partial [Pseudonocardia sp.]|nr:LytR family transcriptional regulator [Pseudonocardia sp.]
LGGIATADVDEGVSPGHLQVVLGGDFDRTLAPSPTTAPPPPAPLEAAITADGVPCVN